MRPKNSAVAVLLAAALACSCAPKRQIRKELPPSDSKTADTQKVDLSSMTSPGVDVTEASLRGSDFNAVSELETVHFEYDSFSLKEDVLSILKKNARYLKDHPELDYLVTGHCDERGTIEYNLALGQKRAKEVREYYIRLGVPGNTIATLSYGKEKPSCAESTEDCWSQNRRAETLIRSRNKAAQNAP